ncbi:MAG: amidase domain-containing protein, partial [Synergistaceae bacterium]|nr:amidase domain-containing protein [Synergistaceae bacterium]
MRKRKFAGIVWAVMLLLLMSSYVSPSSATDARYAASNWQSYANKTASAELGFTLSPNTIGYNCLGFASLVVRHMNNVEVRGYTNDYRVLESSWISGIGSLAGKRSNEVWTIVGQCLGDGRYITTEDVRTAFSNAKVGDWIQMVRKGSSGTKQHSAIISELYDDGFEVVHSNWDAGQIINTYFSYESFAQQCRNAGYINGYNGGFTINHFGDPTPSGIPIDAEHFPDEAFRNCVHEAFDANGDWYLSD